MLNLKSFHRLTKLCNSSWQGMAQFRSYSPNDDVDLLKDDTRNPSAFCPGHKMRNENDSYCPKFASGSCPHETHDPRDSETESCLPKWKCKTNNQVKYKKPFKSMWVTPFKASSEVPERLDNTHYTTSNKTERMYSRTWEECGPGKMHKKKICYLDDVTQPMLEKRTAHDKPITACEQKESELLKINLAELQECMGRDIPKEDACRNTRSTYCRAPRTKVKRNKSKKLECQQRECAPYPSFSECVCNVLRDGSPFECNSTAVPGQCTVFQFEKIKTKYHLAPPVPNWPPQRPK